MKKLDLITSFLFFGCSSNKTVDNNLTSKNDAIQIKSSNENNTRLEINTKNKTSNEVYSTVHSQPATFSQRKKYSAQESLDSLLNCGDSRELVYLIHPTNIMIVYCFHANRSECHIEGVHGDEYFSYDISQVEGQNIGKLTFHHNRIQSSKTFPIRWMTVNDEYAQVQMTSKIMMNSQQHTLHEPLITKYDTGMMVR